MENNSNIFRKQFISLFLWHTLPEMHIYHQLHISNILDTISFHSILVAGSPSIPNFYLPIILSIDK